MCQNVAKSLFKSLPRDCDLTRRSTYKIDEDENGF